MDLKKYYDKAKKLFIRFWKSDDNKISLLRDVLVALMLVLIVLLALWSYTGQWFGVPMVAIETSSMRHLDEPFGRVGTINAGDMVLLVKTNDKNDIEPYIERNPHNIQYGKTGDVIVFHPDGELNRIQIIHRAMCWVEYNEKYDTYTVEGYGIYNETSVTIRELGLKGWVHPKEDKDGNPITPHSGFITKGDNPLTNTICDQAGGLSEQPIKMSWISGKARGEIPWVGTINLLFNDIVNGGESTVKNVPDDCKACLIILIVVLISIPVSLDVYGYIKSKKKEINQK